MIVTFLISFGLLLFFAIFGQTFHENPWLTIPVFILSGAGISSFIVGLISIVAKREKSLLVYLTVGIGLLFIIFEAGDILHY